MAVQPTGTVTLLFSDIEGSTRLLQRLGSERYGEALDLHRRLLREAFDRHGGYEVDCEGDAFFVAFSRASDAVAAAEEGQQALGQAAWPDGHPIAVRMGIHTGEPVAAPPKYLGLDVHKAARIMAAGHGGQVLVSVATQRLLDPRTSLLHLGEHRLKDLSQPESLYQLSINGHRSDFPALKTLGNRPTNLPTVVTPFVGRAQDLEKVRQRLLAADVRLLTLTGPGGVGKTRLALQAAADAIDAFSDGVYWVALASIREPELVLGAISDALGLYEEPDQSLRDIIGRHLAEKRVLLVLDNFEHLIAAARHIGALLQAAPQVRIITTSREALRLNGEHLYEVPPLAVPQPDAAVTTAKATDAVQLFAARARAADSTFVLSAESVVDVANIVRRLDGLPLAVELAAARVRALPPAALARRLTDRLDVLSSGSRDADDRHRTLDATIRWSYELLSRPERKLFAELGVFVGGFRLDAAAAITADDADPFDVLDGIATLLDKSLIRRRVDTDGEPRYWMLETIRQFASDRLCETEDHADVERRFVQFFEQFARDAQPSWMSDEAAVYRTRFRADLDNIRDAMRLALADGHPNQALTIAAFLAGQWQAYALYREACSWVDQALAGGAATPELQGMAHHCLGVMAFEQGDGATALAHLEASLPLLSDAYAGIQVWTRYAMFELVRQYDPDEARRLIDDAVRLAEEDGNSVLRIMTWACQAQAAADDGAVEEARTIVRRLVMLARETGSDNSLANGLRQLGEYDATLGDSDKAREHLSEALGFARAEKSVWDITATLALLALLSATQGDIEATKDHLDALREAARQYDAENQRNRCFIALIESVLHRSAGRTDQAIEQWAEADRLRALQARSWNLVEQEIVVRQLEPLQQQASFEKIWNAAISDST